MKCVKHDCQLMERCDGHDHGGGARGGDSNIKMPRCVCLVSENRPILNDLLSCKT